MVLKTVSVIFVDMFCCFGVCVCICCVHILCMLFCLFVFVYVSFYPLSVCTECVEKCSM